VSKNAHRYLYSLEYILMRLNRIEDAIVYSRNQELSRQNEERFPLLRAMHFKYDLIDRKYSMKALKSMLSQVDRTDPNVHVRDIFVDTENNICINFIDLR
jgi:GTP1/Obg family GTP-binding protein